MFRELMLVTLAVLSVAGCNSRSPVATKPQATTKVARKITREQAVEIVRQEMAKNPKQLQCDYQVLEAGNDEFQVYVDFGTGRDWNGQLTGQFPDSNCTYAVFPNGKAIVIRGGQ